MTIWNLPPLTVALLFFCVDYLAMILIRVIFERKFYLRRWWTFKLGDSIFLPLYGYFAANILHGAVVQMSFWWTVAIVFLGVITMLETEFLHVEEHFYKLNQELLPSQIYHGIIFVVMFYIVGSSLPVILAIHPPTWSFAGAIFAITGYFLLVVKDYSTEKGLRKSYRKTRKKRKR